VVAKVLKAEAERDEWHETSESWAVANCEALNERDHARDLVVALEGEVARLQKDVQDAVSSYASHVGVDGHELRCPVCARWGSRDVLGPSPAERRQS
jgi:hypothetical protein